MNPDLSKLQPYPFEKLAKLKGEVTPPDSLEHIALSIGEPKHPAPEFVLDTLRTELQRVENYPTTKGLPELNSTIASWLERRFSLANVDPVSQVIPVNGTREAIFAFTQAVVNRCQYRPLVVSPNPFYQIYEGAAYLSGAEPHFLPCLEQNGFNPDYDAVPEEIWHHCQMLFVCTPGNPSGSTLKLEDFKKLIDLADQYDFVLASDECYSEIYFDETSPPIGLLDACKIVGNNEFKRSIIFHSLSKRSNLPGLRSGCVSGDRALIEQFLLYRTYHGCAMSPATQAASIAAWRDESHVIANRKNYREKFEKVTAILQPTLEFFVPRASFYLWPKTPIDDVKFCRDLYQSKNVTVLPGQYMGRTTSSGNPGTNRIRMALVAELDDCIEAAERIINYVEGL